MDRVEQQHKEPEAVQAASKRICVSLRTLAVEIDQIHAARRNARHYADTVRLLLRIGIDAYKDNPKYQAEQQRREAAAETQQKLIQKQRKRDILRSFSGSKKS